MISSLMKIFEDEKKKNTFNNWRLPTDQEIKNEWEWEYVRHLKHTHLFKNFNEFYKKVKKGKVIEVTSQFDDRVNYRSHCSTLKELKDLVSHYVYSRDVDRIVNGYKNNDTMPLPIILKFEEKHNVSPTYRILTGNTRMDAAFIVNKNNPKALLVEV